MDGKRHFKVFIDPLDREKVEDKLEAMSWLYKRATTHGVSFEFSKPTLFQKKVMEGSKK
jgi:hypothetical protein